MKKNQVVLNTLSSDTYEVQDNTFVDKWGVVVKTANLPASIKDAQEYTITIGDQSYPVIVNKFNPEMLNCQVSSIKHTLAEVKAGILTGE